MKTAYALSIIIAAFAIFASIGGLLITDLYRDNDFVASMWKWNDLVTLVVACHAGDWPRVRGPDGTGVAQGEEIPVAWSGADGVRVALTCRR